MTAPEALAQPLSFRVLLDEAARLTRRHFTRIYPAVAVPLALLSGMLPLIQWAFFPAAFGGQGSANPATVLGGFAAFAAFMVVWLAVYSLGFGVLFAASVDALAQRAISMRRAWRLMLRPRLLGTLVLSGLASGLGFVFCILPGIYVGLLLSLTIAVMVEEGVFGAAALRRSAELTRYNPQRQLDADPRLKVFVVFFVGALLGYALNMLVQLPLIGAQQALMFRDIASGQRSDPAALMSRLLWLQVPTQILGMLTQTAVNLYTCFGLGLLFFDVKARKEGLDLEAAVARLVAAHMGPAEAPSSSGQPL